MKDETMFAGRLSRLGSLPCFVLTTDSPLLSLKRFTRLIECRSDSRKRQIWEEGVKIDTLEVAERRVVFQN